MNFLRKNSKKCLVEPFEFFCGLRKHSYSNRSSSPKIREILPKVQLEKFTSCLPTIVNDLTNPKTGCMAEIPEVAKRIEDIMFYNLTTGKKTISQIFLSAFWALVAPQNLNEDRLFSAHVLSWTIQMLIMQLMILDDIEDGAEFRRGRLCWHKRADIGLSAITDANLLGEAVYVLLKKYFSTHPNYLNLLHLYHETAKFFLIGQSFDLMSFDKAKSKPNFDIFTAEKYDQLIQYKCSIGVSIWTVKAAILISDYPNLEIDQSSYQILNVLGKVFQIENDVLDVFADEKTTLKTSNDIVEGKCTWLAVKALEKGSDAQKKVFFQNYGKRDSDSRIKIEDLYKEMKLLDEYHVFIQKTLEQVEGLLKKPNVSLPKTFLESLIGNILLKKYF